MSFTHLNIRTGYSFFNSTIKIDQLVNRASEFNFSALALTDENVLYGVIPFYKACINNGIKPIIGMIVQVQINDQMIPCTLLAKSNRGYKNLIQISTYIQTEATCTIEVISQYQSDLICIVSSQYESLKKNLLHEQFDQAKEILQHFCEIFPREDVYISAEIYTEIDQSLLEKIKEFVSLSNITAVAIQDVRYLDEKDVLSFDCLQAMKFNEKWDSRSVDISKQQRYFRSMGEMKNVFSNWPDLIEKTEEIVQKCHVTFSFGDPLLPSFPVPDGKTSSAFLREQCEMQLDYRYEHVTEEIVQRLHNELKIIEELSFSDYFLIVADFVQFAKDNDILVGPGRGSAAGSIVAYLLGITNVDPIKYDLLFERFLNPERITMPDIDIDFSDVRRDEVIEYVKNKYGQEYVAQIITFGTFGARSLLRELMKTMDIDERDQAYILRQIPVQANEPLTYYIKQSKEFAEYIKQTPALRLLFLIAIKLEGLPRHISTHAAGIVIGKDPLTEHVPLTKGSHDVFLTQYAMNELEAIGLLKIDILGLRNLTIMERIIQSVNKTLEKPIDLNTLPEHDEKTFALLRAGKTNGIFQLESSGMKRVLVQMKPSTLEDIIALNALYRPGPMEHIPTYIARKHGKERINYVHPDLEPILAPTYGVLVYQEQIMQVANIVANYSFGEADILRRAISKKEKQTMEEQKEAFINGAINNGYDEHIAKEIFSWIVRFANYGFNKSHSVAYSKIGYQLSYLKANYPTHFFAQILSSVMNDPARLKMYMREANENGIEILPPSINKSYGIFTVEKGNIRIGFMAIKGIGYETVKEIIRVRKEKQYTDLFDFCLRASIKRNVLETLILAGAFDETYTNRASLLASIDQAIARKELFGDMNGQENLFSGQLNMKPNYIQMEDFSQMKKLQDEKDLLHVYVTSHPFKQYRPILTRRQYLTLYQSKNLRQNSVVKLVAIIQTIRKIHTKRGDSMAFMTIADETEEMEAVIFPKLYREVNRMIQEEQTVIIEGKISIRENETQVIVNKITPTDLDTYFGNSEQTLYIRLKEQNERALGQILQIAQQYPGKTQVIVYNEMDKKAYKLGIKYHLQGTENVINKCKQVFGDKNVVLK